MVHWYKLKQKFRLKGQQIFINDELTLRMSKLVFEARVAKWNGVIADCKATPLGVILKIHADELVE